ncbi:MBL fold metallo-hydrolase [Pseudidiomarina gelatinasegens]|uniref:MBL fold metallo-hydrolase n=1 Tax=Pseudidiomarina gelatinasegens TaxID=2487740 RepID=A0A443YZ73_9GAMM|nr:MBL fold metallo-hydrolase [Pseudidiomarina gelatinasegens]RWU09516.1 MBL fold metallo-hydrolase [Pseudidiomarina gelatinasegens]
MIDNAVKVKAFLDEDSETFSYVLYHQDEKQAVVIDPVLDFDYKSGRTNTKGAQRIVDFVNSEGLHVAWVLETHAHADHLSAAPFVKEQVGGHIGIGEHIKDVQKIFKDVFDLEKEFLPNGHQFDHLFKDGETFNVGAMNFRVLHTPGHTPADLCYIVNEQMIFVGDTLFMPDVGTARCDFPGGSAATLFQSIKKILALPEATEIYICHDYPPAGRGHEYKTTVGAQRKHSKHVHDGVSEAEFVKMREERDAGLEMPRLILPSIQVNIRAGHMPPADENGKVYLKLPIDQL